MHRWGKLFESKRQTVNSQGVCLLVSHDEYYCVCHLESAGLEKKKHHQPLPPTHSSLDGAHSLQPGRVENVLGGLVWSSGMV